MSRWTFRVQKRRRLAEGVSWRSLCQVAKCLSTSKARDQQKPTTINRARCQLRHVAARRPLPKWPLWEGPSISFLIHSASVHYSPPLKEDECPHAAPDKKRPLFYFRSRTFCTRLRRETEETVFFAGCAKKAVSSQIP